MLFAELEKPKTEAIDTNANRQAEKWSEIAYFYLLKLCSRLLC